MSDILSSCADPKSWLLETKVRRQYHFRDGICQGSERYAMWLARKLRKRGRTNVRLHTDAYEWNSCAQD
jgi:hypothetical protein